MPFHSVFLNIPPFFFRVLVNDFLVIRQNWGVDSGKGQLGIPRRKGHMVEGSSLSGAGELATL